MNSDSVVTNEFYQFCGNPILKLAYSNYLLKDHVRLK